jgi:hypothetical protein
MGCHQDQGDQAVRAVAGNRRHHGSAQECVVSADRRSIPCIRRKSNASSNGKAHRPCEFGVNVSVTPPSSG